MYNVHGENTLAISNKKKKKWQKRNLTYDYRNKN